VEVHAMAYRSNISNDANKILDKLIERQKEFQALEKVVQRLLFVFLPLFLITALYIYNTTVLRSANNIEAFYEAFTNNLVIILIIINALVYYTFIYYARKKNDKSKKLEALRIEVIDRFDAPWLETTKSRIKDKISEEMKNYGINIVHKN